MMRRQWHVVLLMDIMIGQCNNIIMMTTKLYNSLKFYMLSIHESDQLAEDQTQEYVDKFNSLDKYDQLEISFQFECGDIESALISIDELIS